MADLLKIGLVIAAIVVLVRLKVALSITLFASAAALGLLYGLPLAGIGGGALRALLNAENLKLVAALQLVLLFSAVLKETRCIGRAIAALSRIFGDARPTVAFIPAVVGLLPVVGGAMLSAPLVAEAADELALSPERRTFLNYWFRHVWEYTVPTFSAVFLTAGILGISIVDLVAANLPLSAAAILAGVVFGFRGVRPAAAPTEHLGVTARGRLVFDVLLNLLPFMLVVLLTLVGGIHLAYGLALVTAGTAVAYRLNPATLARLARQHLSLDLAALIWAIMVFKEILVATAAMDRIAAQLAALGMPPVALVVVLPALIAFITGYTTAFVGLSFPVLLPLIPPGPLAPYYAMLALASGVCAHMLSPMHACLVMTLEYYQARLAATYRLLLAPAAAVLLTAAGVFAAAHWLAG
jgi:hypothetical protein